MTTRAITAPADREQLLTRQPGQRPQASPGDPGAIVRVGVYVRRSTDDEHQPYSIQAQDTRLAAYVSSQPGWRQAVLTTPPGLPPAGPACSWP
jgi:hypothetical protein